MTVEEVRERLSLKRQPETPFPTTAAPAPTPAADPAPLDPAEPEPTSDGAS